LSKTLEWNHEKKGQHFIFENDNNNKKNFVGEYQQMEVKTHMALVTTLAFKQV